ncbi:MAG TPA: Mut7-C RNAse domain-containing protein [Bryobacteraceae bacterium]|nr:Mut7-C RNAse domain-containing protein [Bryobacteraceae bacterium]
MSPILVRFRVAETLRFFLKPPFRVPEFEHSVGATDTVKHAVESLGIPHTEVGEFRIGSDAVPESAQMRNGDVLHVLPAVEPVILDDPRFIADGHLGRLAAYLRMLGFDCWYDRTADDTLLADVASADGRVLLTRDVGLLKRRQVESGYCVRSDKPHDQLHEVARRFALATRMTPFQRCMDCNGYLEAVTKQEVEHVLPPHTRETRDVFSRCARCGKIYWRGSHHERMLGWIAGLTNPANVR